MRQAWQEMIMSHQISKAGNARKTTTPLKIWKKWKRWTIWFKWNRTEVIQKIKIIDTTPFKTLFRTKSKLDLDHSCLIWWWMKICRLTKYILKITRSQKRYISNRQSYNKRVPVSFWKVSDLVRTTAAMIIASNLPRSIKSKVGIDWQVKISTRFSLRAARNLFRFHNSGKLAKVLVKVWCQDIVKIPNSSKMWSPWVTAAS